METENRGTSRKKFYEVVIDKIEVFLRFYQ